MAKRLHTIFKVVLLMLGSATLLFSCKSKPNTVEESRDAIKTEECENLTIIMSENGRKSYLFKTPLLEGYLLGRDPYREFRKGISITTYQDDSLTTVNAVLVANYAIYYENRKLWEAKGDVVITKHDGTRIYTQQLFWNSLTKRIYSNVDTRLVNDTDEVIGEGFESDEEMMEPRFRRWKGKMQVDTEQMRNSSGGDSNSSAKSKPSVESKPKQSEKSTAKSVATTKSKSAITTKKPNGGAPNGDRPSLLGKGGRRPMGPRNMQSGAPEKPNLNLENAELQTTRTMGKIEKPTE